MPDHISPQIVSERSRHMHALGANLERTFRRRFLGRTMDVLWEADEPSGDSLVWSGLTDNYLRISAPGGPGLRNVVTPVRLVADTPGGLTGEVAL
jgi:threonylcarbamoyladenosine tRNA methylthiotransferase MtaB